MTQITPQPGIMEIALYQGGQSNIEGVTDVVKLSSNENPFGTSELAKEAFARARHELHRYPPTDHASLRAAIAEVHKLDAGRIICGAGSDEVLQFVTQAYAGVGDEIIYTEHGFSMYPILAHMVGAVPVRVPERERTVDVDAILNACTDKTKIVFIANPANPTGTMIGGNEVARLATGLPKGCILVHDGAYTEYVEGFDGGAGLVESCDNVLMTRTFSKIHGLGGLRIGWGYGPKDMIDVMNRIRQPFNLSVAQLATAEAAIRDTEFVERCRSENTRLRAWLAEALAELGIPSDTSTANFILARFASEQEATDCDTFLKKEGIIVRRVGGYGLPNCLRITVGDEASCRRVVYAVKQFKGVAP
ncbi:histidinol-phosphate aminotransferase [Actibacterium atlanticum]|uniref:Histidinol-phosphate aminotransferase n=1 Tax=Actibacterium atlanticum TaxID=1461693 RepID=A0A058ZP56_9RHOB|nr:histidinol-phosphate transaminase [Actibacterium atlanticum]KCV82947.1 histidinol-phosphate aminotransferase [Actibacterium atlanticum]